MRPGIDYALARRSVIREVRRGTRTRLDVCDAHPELLRAARHVGVVTADDCPLCATPGLRQVSYVYGDTLKRANGRVVTGPDDLERLGTTHDEFTLYLVEVCLDCSWNYLLRTYRHHRRHAG